MKNTKAELKDNELEEVNGGIFIVLASNMPEKRPDERYVMAAPTADEIISELKS